ncbi:MAG: FecR domain-containing protein [Deltaproteobacteria bacterium]|nr:FecR domain-containing protein [Deltaproteobacteria bacterium]
MLKNRLVIFFLSLAVFLFMSNPVFAGIGNIAKQSGAAFFKAKGQKDWIAAVQEKELNQGDRLKTGDDGRMELSLNDGSKLALGNSTELEITEFLLSKTKRNATVFLLQGKLRASVASFSGKTNMNIKTPTAVAGIKGTDFIAMNQGKANVFFGQEGTVSVSGTDKERVALLPDTMTENTRGHKPIEPVKVEPDTPLFDARKLLVDVTTVDVPVEWKETGKLPLILARWNINYGHYLADAGKYKEALEVLQIALDLTESPDTSADAHLERGTILSRYLNMPEDALKEYQTVIDKYSQMPQKENAVYSSGVIYMDIGNKAKAREFFKEYLKSYPQGKHAATVDLMLEKLEKE